MSDLISRQAAIDAAKKNTFRLTFAEEQNCEGHVAWSAEAVYSDVMEGALLDLPSAQPDVPDINVGDMISRQATVEALNAMLNAFKKVRDNLPEDKREEYTDSFCKLTGKMYDELGKEE